MLLRLILISMLITPYLFIYYFLGVLIFKEKGIKSVRERGKGIYPK